MLGVIFELLGGLLDITLKAGAAFALWTIYRAVEAGRMQTPAAEPVVEAPRAITDDAPPVWRAAEAVSYTHLDVYKRQDLGGIGLAHDVEFVQPILINERGGAVDQR